MAGRGKGKGATSGNVAKGSVVIPANGQLGYFLYFSVRLEEYWLAPWNCRVMQNHKEYGRPTLSPEAKIH